MTSLYNHTGGTSKVAPAALLSHVHFSYDEQTKVLTDISLTIEQGDCLALVGPNGGGKTTILRLLLGLATPLEGEVRVFGKKPASAVRSIGYVPQFSTIERDFPATVLDMVLMGAAEANLRGGTWPTNKKAKNRAKNYLSLLGIADLAKRPLHALSGGQRQRALVARALMGGPEEQIGHPGNTVSPFLLLLDEPTASIDPEGTFCFYEFLGQLRGLVTIIVVSHDLFMISPYFSTVAFVNSDLTLLQGNQLTPENLTRLFGSHQNHACPLGDAQRSLELLHGTCTCGASSVQNIADEEGV